MASQRDLRCLKNSELLEIRAQNSRQKKKAPDAMLQAPKFQFAFLFALFIFISPLIVCAGASPFLNIRERLSELNLTPYFSKPSVRPVVIAVFDLDFTGWDQEKGKTLPSQTEYRTGPHASTLPASGHGLAMAQIAWAAASGAGTQSDRPVRMLLYQTAGHSQFKWAAEDAIKENVDVILYAQVWEFGSNFDGKGFLNVVVDKAIAAGITWVNAAGNYGSLTYNAQVHEQNDNAELTCAPSQVDGSVAPIQAAGEPAVPTSPEQECALRMVLSWNDFTDDSTMATTKDLDLDLVDLMGKVVGSSHLRQVGAPAPGETSSKYAREMIEISVKPGRYFAHVSVKSDNFSRQDKFRIVVSGNGISMPDATRDDSVLPPADNKNAITASAGDSDIASWSAESGKPDFWTNSKIEMADHALFFGSSNSAALIAGAVALLKSEWPEAALTSRSMSVRDLKLDDIASLVDLNTVGRLSGTGLSSSVTGVSPSKGGSCFSERVSSVNGSWLPGALPVDGSAAVAGWSEKGAAWVNTTAGPKLVVGVDPVSYFAGMKRSSASDAIMVDAQTGKPNLVSRGQVAAATHSGLIEILQLPSGTTICGREAGSWKINVVDRSTDGQRSPYFSLPPIAAFEAWIK